MLFFKEIKFKIDKNNRQNNKIDQLFGLYVVHFNNLVHLSSVSAEDLKVIYSSDLETVRKRRKNSESKNQREKQNESEEKSQNFMIALAFILVLTFWCPRKESNLHTLANGRF